MNSIVTFFAVTLISISEGQRYNVCDTGNYSYEDRFKWPRLYQACAGSKQSPIDIETTAKSTNRVYLNTKLHLKDYNKRISSVTIENDGKTVHVEPKEKIVITGGPAKGDYYQLEKFHFHFGNKYNDGSEHTINGHRHAMEIHFVHWNTKYSTTQEAQRHADGLLVIGVLAKLDESSETGESLSFLTKNLERVKSPSKIKVRGPIYLSGLLPKLKRGFSYWTYAGSLTTPMCNEAVTWVISSNILRIKNKQLKAFRTLTDSCQKPIAGNIRPLQHRSGRQIGYV